MRSRHIFRLILQLQFEVAAHEHDFLADFFAWAFAENRGGFWDEFFEGGRAKQATIYALLPRLPSSLHLIILFKKVLTPRRACRFTVRLRLGFFLCVFLAFLVFGSGSGSHRKTDRPARGFWHVWLVEQGRQPWQQNVQRHSKKPQKNICHSILCLPDEHELQIGWDWIGLSTAPHLPTSTNLLVAGC